jgi:hypothetical protein
MVSKFIALILCRVLSFVPNGSYDLMGQWILRVRLWLVWIQGGDEGVVRVINACPPCYLGLEHGIVSAGGKLRRGVLGEMLRP